MKVLGNKNIWFILSGAAVLASVLLWIAIGFRYGIDFTGGSLMEIEYQGMERPVQSVVAETLSPFNLSAQISTSDVSGYMIRSKEINESTHQQILEALKKTAVGKDGAKLIENRFDSIGPVVGQELKSKSVTVLILVLIGIILYVAWSFRKVSYPIKSWKYGTIAVVALIHDVTITAGVFILAGHYLHWEIGTPFVAAILTVLGYSVNDTIVVFDRIRENLHRHEGNFEDIVEKSVQETMGRSVSTSMTVLIALLSVYIFGGDSIKPFALPLIIGVFVGTYSSIFLASPLLVVWQQLDWKLRKGK